MQMDKHVSFNHHVLELSTDLPYLMNYLKLFISSTYHRLNQEFLVLVRERKYTFNHIYKGKPISKYSIWNIAGLSLRLYLLIKICFPQKSKQGFAFKILPVQSLGIN